MGSKPDRRANLKVLNAFPWNFPASHVLKRINRLTLQPFAGQMPHDLIFQSKDSLLVSSDNRFVIHFYY
jgi:hypothetical protein